MGTLERLAERRAAVGAQILTEDRKKNHNNAIELARIDGLIVEEVMRMWKADELEREHGK